MTTETIESTRISLHDMRMLSGKPGSGISRLCGTTYRSLRNWETGAATPNIVNVHDLLQIYGYSFYQLDLAPFYTGRQDQTERQSKIDGMAQKPIPVSHPPKNLSLYDMRKAARISGETVADTCGVSYRTLLNWEKGASIPNVINVYDLLQIYGYSFYELDLIPFYTVLEERSKKQREMDDLTDNPLRERRRFAQDGLIDK